MIKRIPTNLSCVCRLIGARVLKDELIGKKVACLKTDVTNRANAEYNREFITIMYVEPDPNVRYSFIDLNSKSE